MNITQTINKGHERKYSQSERSRRDLDIIANIKFRRSNREIKHAMAHGVR